LLYGQKQKKTQIFCVNFHRFLVKVSHLAQSALLSQPQNIKLVDAKRYCIA